MIALREWPPATLRRLNLRLFDDPEYPYDLDSMAGLAAEEATRQRIRNMKDVKIHRLLDAAPDCPVGSEQGFRDWWAAWMPIIAGRQLWPDGNHRVGMMVAELVAETAGFTMVLDETDIEHMRRESKAIVAQRWRHGPKVTEAEFTRPDHPLCAFYWNFRNRLVLERRPPQE